MAPSEGIPSDLDEKSFENVVKFVSNVRTGKLQGSIAIAHATVDLLEQIISDADNTTALALCNKVRAVGRHLIDAVPSALTAANMVRRVLRAIRDEQRANVNQSVEAGGESLHRLVLLANPGRRGTLGPDPKDLKEPLRDFIAELRAELESSVDAVCSQAKEHIQADELVLSHGAGVLLERFLRAAGRRYRLVVAEGPDVRESHAMAARLSAAGVSVTVVTAAAAPALVARANKVVISATAAVGGGAVIAPVGTALITTAATHLAVPVIVLCPLLKLSPVQTCDQYFFKAQDTSHQAIPYQSLESVDAFVVAQKFDFIRPNQVSLFITNLCGSSPSYVYRLLSELYDPLDYQL